MTIKIKDKVINSQRFVFADLFSTNSVRICLEGLPDPHNYIYIKVKNSAEGEKVLDEINEKMQKNS